jgi:endonuclease/exonuclease/phosphatase family metal-dependent hydrolase
VTFNVWFAELHRDIRTTGLLNYLQQADADVIALQEVLPCTFCKYRENAFLTKEYVWSTLLSDDMEPYGALMLVKKSLGKVNKTEVVELPSYMDRKGVIMHVDIHGSIPFSFATVHLESLSMAPVRQQQALLLYNHLLDCSGGHAVLMGDFNLLAPWEDEKVIHPKFIDVWSHVHPHATESESFTYDTKLNPMLDSREGWRNRLDRITMCSAGDLWKPKSIVRVGVEEAFGLPADVRISDHFGLEAVLEYS